MLTGRRKERCGYSQGTSPGVRPPTGCDSGARSAVAAARARVQECGPPNAPRGPGRAGRLAREGGKGRQGKGSMEAGRQEQEQAGR